MFALVLTTVAQSVTVTQPNGSETLYGCQTYQIKWTATGVSNFWNIEYSLNNGATWTTDATNLSVLPSGGVYTYTWTIPSVVSSTCLVRITDFSDALKTDNSNAVFAVAQAVVVNTPNGGESWQGLTNQSITWSNPGTAGPFNIAYSVNGGSTWTSIQSNYSGTSLTWSVPNNPNTTALVRVQNAGNTCQSDVSNANFTITAATPLVTAPNGGESWTIGTVQNITWNSATYYSSVNIEYSTNNGSTWTTIATGDPNDGTYAWTVPNASSSQALVRVSNNANPAISDVSNAVFSIVPGSVTITQPNGGETLYGCQSYQIRWTASGTSNFWNIEYSLNNGSTWTSEATNLSIGPSGGVYTYGWTVPSVTSTSVLVRVTDFNDNLKFDISNAIFTIAPAITVTFPNGGENLQGLTSQSVTWNSPGSVGPFTLAYSVNNGTSWSTIVSSVTGNTYSWTVPNNPSALSLVRVTNSNNNCQFDISNANFTINPATPVLTAPNGGETLVIGTNSNITWTASTFYSTVNLDYSTNNGSTWTPIATNEPNDGVYTWAVPNAPSSQALVRASNSANTTVNDVSNATFSIVPGSVTVTSPNGGDLFYSCRTTAIQWTATGVSNFWNIDYSLNNGSTWTSIATSLSVTPSGGVYTYNWTIPFVASTQTLIRVRDFNDLAKTDQSNAVFTIAYPITVVTNNGGTTWQGNTVQNITWTAAGLINGTLTLQYSIDNGTSWNTISSGEINDGTYSWTVPNTPSTQALIRVRDNVNTCQVDNSDAVFTISEPAPILTSPNGGEVWTVNSNRSITWNSNSFYSTVNLEYSINNGSTWTPIASGLNNTGGYSWLVPYTPSTQALVRASNSANTAINDVSNAVFTIQMPTPLVTAPNGGETWNIGTTQNITWNSTTFVSAVKIEYSADNGVTWNLITSSTPNTGSYSWTIPNNPSSQALVRIMNTLTGATTVGDTSNGVFTIAQPLITVTNPTAATQWQVNQPVTINYTTGSGVTNVRIEYSTNGGLTWTTIVTSTTNTGSYSWTVPNISGAQNVIRVSNAANLAVNGSSPFFTVLQPMTVTAPNGGETLTGCQTYTVTTTKTPYITGSIIIEYSTDNGLNWNSASSGSQNNQTTQSFNWTVPNITSNTTLVRAYFSNLPAARDSSDGFFTVSPSQDITVLTPVAPVNYTPGQTVTISWSNTVNVSGLYVLQWVDSLGSVSSIASSVTGNNYIWTVPNNPKGGNKFRIYDQNNSCRIDLSDTTFRILANSPMLTYPNGGEVFDINDAVSITWNSNTYYNNVRIEYSANNGFTWNLITSSASNNGSYNWTVPAVLSTQCIVRVMTTTNLLLGDTSNAVFTIRKPVQLLTPLATDSFIACNNITGTFRRGTNVGTTYSVWSSTDNGANWDLVVTNQSLSGNTPQSFSFAPPVSNYAGPMRLRVQTNNGATYADTMYANFKIVPFTGINLVTPNGGQTFNAGTQQLIGWNNTLGLTSFNLQYSQNGGASWAGIANSQGCCSYTWTVPNINSNQVVVRVLDANNTCRADTSNATFTVIPTAPILTSPNGGEVWNVNSTQTITWNSATFFSNVRLAYSLDNGVNWILITNATTNTGSYSWTVPNAISTQCLVRASNVSDTTWFDVSNNTFTIQQPKPVLIAPNGGEVFDIGSTQTISWNANSVSSSTIRLEYSANNGLTWTIITSSTSNSGSYNWTVPAAPTTQALVRIVNLTFTAQMDTSDNPFTILTPIQVLYPNVIGDSLKCCQSLTITFRKQYTYSSTLYAYYTLDNGVNWNYINSNTFTSNSQGSFSWTVPTGLNSNNVRIKITNQADPDLATLYQDSSDQQFSIKMPVADITVTAPNGGQTLNALTNATITWTNGPTASGLFRLRYRNNATGTNSTIASNVTGNAYIWTVPNVVGDYKIWVEDQNNTCKFDTSDNYFTIVPATPVLTSPNGGEFWGAGTSNAITWTTSTVYSGATVRLDYSLDSGLTWNLIVTGLSNSGSYNWTVPNQQSGNTLVKISTVGTLTLTDVSNAVFTIGYPTPVLTSPNSGTFEYLQPVTISWTPASFNSTTVRLEYSVDSGTTWTLISTQTTSTGSYSWTAPSITTNRFLVRVLNTLNLNVWDASNSVMTINRPVRLNSFATDTSLNGCQTVTFSVSRTPYYSSNLVIQYSTDGGTTWSGATSISSGGNVNQTVTWTVPNTNAPNVIVNAYFSSNALWSDTADKLISFVPNYPIMVTAPNTGVSLTPGQLYTISWTNTANVSGLYNIVLYNGSSSAGTLASNITGNNWIWTVPNTPGTNWKVRVRDDNSSCKYDSSDVPFTIIPKTPLVTAPNGGEIWWAGQAKTITWDASTFYNSVRIDYSLDNGFTWINIGTGISNSGSYSWTLPWTTPRSLQALVRVSDNTTLTTNDVSDAVFTINPAVRILTPNGGLQLGACTNSSISFEHSPQIQSNSWTFKIEYSLNNGINWVTLATSQSPQTSTLTTYNYSIPNSASTQYIARVSVAQSTSYFDISDSLNQIKPAVTIIQPNFGGVLQVGSTYQVKWSSDGISNLYNLYYSTTGYSGPYSTIQLNYNTATNQYSWTVPNTPSNNCYLVIQDATASCKSDTSNLSFIISSTSSQITVTAPNGGDTLSGCQSYNITWADAGANGPYNLAYTTDGAATYTTIASNVSGTSYAWVVPNINSGNVLVRVQSAAAPTVFDLSNALFTIKPGAVVATPDTIICQGQSAQLLATGGNGVYSWTPSATLSNANIANPVATPTVTTTYTATSNNAGCVLSDTARVTVVPGGVVPASVTIAASPGTGICSGSSVTFTATPVNGGTSPSFQWKKNGTNVGTNSSTYITNTIANNDVITCVMTSNGPCVTNNPATSNALTMTVFPSVAPSISISASSSSICSGANITFTATATNGGGSPVYQWKKNGNNVGTNSNTYSTTTLANNDVISCELTSSASCATPVTITSNSIQVTVNQFVTPTITISTSTTTVCSGQSVQFTASVTNGGTTPAYQWKKNGNNVGTGLITYTTTTLANNDVITCELTSNAACPTPATVTSNTLTMNVVSSAVPSVAIVADDTTVCSGTTVNFTATPTNGGSSPSYQWKVGSTNVGTNSATYSSNSLANGSVVTCVMTSNFACASPATATSSSITMVVNPTSAPTVSVAASPAGAVCAGTSVTFTATAGNAGGSPSYQWKLNSNNVGGNSATYSSSALVNGDVITCVVTSSSGCASPNTATSSAITMTVNSNTAPTVSISTTTNNVCAGSSVLFTSSITNGGTTPVYQWKVNGNNVGTNSSSFSSTTLANNDVVTCVLTSNAACATPATATSSGVTMTVTPVAAPSISITTTSTTVCAGVPVTFTATATNGGSTPAYQWKVGSTNVGTNSSTFTTSALVNGNAVSCVLTSNAACASPTTATSNTLNVTVNPSVTPAVSISASSTSICSGTNVTFTAAPTNGGASPAYQWKVNGNNVGTGLATYSSTALANNDVVTCVLTSNASCAATTTATSNAVTITVGNTVTPAVTVSATSTSVCAGTLVTFTATPTNGGASPSYQWKLNGNNVGTNSASYSSSTLANNDQVTCVLTSNAACVSTATASGNTITMTVTPSVTPAVAISASSTNICTGTSVTFTATPTNGGATPVYQWKVNGNNVGTNSNTYSSATLNNNDLVSCVMTSNATCASPASVTSNALSITVNSLSAATVTISTGSTTVCAGASVTFNASVTNAGSSPSYQWKVNGTPSGTNSSSFSTTSLANGAAVTCEFTSTSPCAGTTTVNSNSISMTVNSSVVPAVSIAASSTNICTGQSVTFTATPTNGGTTPAYQWKVNGTNAGNNSATFTSTTMANNDVVTAILTSSLTCAVPATDTSNAVTMTVGSNATPTITISTPTNTVCAGANVTFTAAVTNGGSAPAYQWKVNNNNAGTNAATFTTNTLTNGAVVTCVLTSNAACVTQSTANANSITMTVNPTVTPSLSISATATTICAGSSVTFTASPTNGGSTPAYQWKVNGNNVGSNSATYSSTALANGDLVTCVMTGSAACATLPTATSNTVTMTVNTAATPAVSISASTNNICAGTSVTFTATPTSGGTTPVYQWKVGSANVGSNSATFTSTTLANNDVVTCVLTSNAACATPLTATSNAVTMSVNPVVVPTITVAATNSVCVGGVATFSATITNGGAAPAYQWKVNGNNQGTNSASFSSNSLANGDVVTCVLTSNANCATPTTATSNQLTVNILPNVTPAVSISASATNICGGASVTFTATPTNGGNAPAYQWFVNGNNAGTNSNTYTTTTLANGDVVSCQLTSNAACATTATALSNNVTISVGSSVTPSVSISASTNNICAGTSVTFTAVATNGGSSPVYQWKVGSTNVGGNSATFTSTTLNNNDVVTCVLTSNAACASPLTTTSNAVTMSVTPASTPTITVTATNSVCAGGVANFVATTTNGGSAPAYQWKVNGNNQGTNSANFSSNALVSGDVVTCVLTSNANCATTTTATSNQLTVAILPSVTPALSITASATSICSGASVTFTATPANGGNAPAYQWLVNGNNAGTNSSTFITTTLNNGDVVSCQLTSNASCLSTATAQSNNVTVSVSAAAVPSVSISASATNICAGASVTFTATPVNGGTTPAYQWKVNNIATGTNSATFTTSTLNNNDVVTCVMTSNAGCVTTSTATSNSVTITVSSGSQPFVNISASGNSICGGTSVTFTATATNAGANPTYQWKVNGNNVGVNSNTYTDASLSNGDIVVCAVISSAPCSSGSVAGSNNITMVVNPSVTPAVSISATAANICQGTSVVFTATATNGGTAPVYQWKLNGNNVGTNSATYSSTTLANNDVVTVELTSNVACATTTAATSNAVTMIVNGAAAPTVTVAVSPANQVCAGTQVVFTASVLDGGTSPSYQWRLNGNTIGFNSPVYSAGNFADGDIVTVEVTSNATCVGQPTAISAPQVLTVYALPAAPTIAQSGNVLTSSAVSGNQWLQSGSPIVGATAQAYTTVTTGWYAVEVTDANGCSAKSDSTFVNLTSIKGIALEEAVRILPNPFYTEFSVAISEKVGSLEGIVITITDELGRVVYENRQVQHHNLISLAEHAAGVYYVQVKSGKEQGTFRVMKQN